MTAAPADFPGPVPGPFDHRRYVPILLTRQGERHALRVISPTVRAALRPLFVVHPVATDPRTGLPKMSVEQHITKIAKELVKDWGVDPAFIDLSWVDTSQPMPNGTHAVEWFVGLADSLGLKLAPAISAGHDPAYRAAAVSAAHGVGTTLCLRLTPQEWHDLGTPVGDGRLAGLLAETGRPATDVHLILDFGAEITATTSLAIAAIRPALQSLPLAYDWASVTVAGTGMPVGTAEVGAGGAAELPRLEWILWQQLTGPGYRRPSFGDYAVQHPDPRSDFNPLFMDSAAQLRYTISQAWFVARGRGVRKVGHDQIRGLAQQVCAHPEYASASFSWGDDWLYQCANGTCRPGAQGVWRKVTTNHHLTFVVSQLANLVGP